MQRPQALPPQADPLALEPGGADQGGVIQQALEAGGILQQAATAEHQHIASSQGPQHPREAAPIGGGNPEAALHHRLIPGGDQGLPTLRQLAEQHLQQRIVAEVVLAVVAAEQNLPAAVHALISV